MKNSFGQSISYTVFGESHGPCVGIVADGLSPGLPVDEAEIARLLSRRRPSGATDTARTEPDSFRILSGVFNGKTTGTPLCIIIPNENTDSQSYAYGIARPSHADYTAHLKYHGFEDYRGGGHFSGRITAAFVALGGILLPALQKKGIAVGTHIAFCAGVHDRPFSDTESDILCLQSRFFPTLDEAAGERMRDAIQTAKNEADSVGGVVEAAVTGVPAGIGEPWFDSLESVLSHALFSIGGIKGVSFGDGFRLAGMRGSEANDSLRMDNDHIVTETNHNGGINGGIANGMPLLFRCAVKPTPSIGLLQNTVDFIRCENTTMTVTGRHDPAIVRRICPVIDSITAMVLCDMLAVRYGTDSLTDGAFPS